MIKEFYKHFAMDGVTYYIEGMPMPAKLDGPRCELKFIGPNVMKMGTDTRTDISVFIDLTIPRDTDLFTWEVLAQQYVDQANVPLAYDEDSCWVLDGTNIEYRGAIENLEYCTIEVSYHKEN